MKLSVASLFLAFSFIASPAFAQGPRTSSASGGVIQSLANDLAALTTRVEKLEGTIVASDLAGTYSVQGIDTSMHGFRAGTPPQNAAIDTSAFRGSLTLNADGTGSTGSSTPFPGCEGSTLTLGSGAVTGLDDCDEGPTDVTWTYANGVVTVTFLNDGDELPFTVALGGRLLILAFAPFHASDQSSNQVLIIATRLR